MAELLANPESDLYFSDDPAEQAAALEDRDYYASANVFWVPAQARWESLRNQAKQANIGQMIDDALVAIEDENPRLKNLLDKRFARTQIEPVRLGALVDLVSKIGFDAGDKSKDVLGEVYEYFLGQFASAEGKKGGQFYTPASVVRTLVAMLSPPRAGSTTPAPGRAGCLCSRRSSSSLMAAVRTTSRSTDRSRNPTTWRLVAMNLAIRGIGFDLGNWEGVRRVRRESDQRYARERACNTRMGGGSQIAARRGGARHHPGVVAQGEQIWRITATPGRVLAAIRNVCIADDSPERRIFASMRRCIPRRWPGSTQFGRRGQLS